ncbi:MAG: hypothetical protein R6V78_17845 [Desulfosarcina sp.]
MQSVYSLFDWAIQRDMMVKNYASGMRIKQTKRPDESKEPFSSNDLKRLFGSMTNEKDHKFWIPFIGLYTGARLEEICQLDITDIRQEDDIWVFDINERDDKRLKTLNAKRSCPIWEIRATAIAVESWLNAGANFVNVSVENSNSSPNGKASIHGA